MTKKRNGKFFDETKTAIHSKLLHANVTEMYGKGKYVEINDDKAMTVSRRFHHHDTLPVRWYTKSSQTGSLHSCHHGSCNSHEKKHLYNSYVESYYGPSINVQHFQECTKHTLFFWGGEGWSVKINIFLIHF